MSKRPTYAGIPTAVEAATTARRQSAEGTQAAPSPPLPPPPTLIETRWKALEDRLDSIEANIDMLIDHLNAPGR